MQKIAQRLPFYTGLGLITAATLMLQIVETRIISVTSWYHLAFFVISIAMFGLTAGAVWVYLPPRAVPPGAAVLSPERRLTQLRPCDPGAPGAVDHRHEPARIGHVTRRLD